MNSIKTFFISCALMISCSSFSSREELRDIKRGYALDPRQQKESQQDATINRMEKEMQGLKALIQQQSTQISGLIATVQQLKLGAVKIEGRPDSH